MATELKLSEEDIEQMIIEISENREPSFSNEISSIVEFFQSLWWK